VGGFLGPVWEFCRAAAVFFEEGSHSKGVSRDQNEAPTVAHEALETHGAVGRSKKSVGKMRRGFRSHPHRQLHSTGRHLFPMLFAEGDLFVSKGGLSLAYRLCRCRFRGA
jgi:hypothetical protein